MSVVATDRPAAAKSVWHERDDYVGRFGSRPVLWTGSLPFTRNWNWTPQALVMPLRGQVVASVRGLRVMLRTHDVLVVESGSSLRLDPPPAQRDAVVAVQWLPGGLPGLVDLLPTCHRQDAELALAISRRAAQAPSGLLVGDVGLQPILDMVVRRQRDLSIGIEHCPGRSPRHRRQLFARLLRARNLVDFGPTTPLDLATLASVASLSPSHFLRLFHRVFGLPPHRYMMQQRLGEARRMVVETGQPIGVIAQRLGFVNRCAFARLFKQYFGVPATRLRRQSICENRGQPVRLVQ